MATCLLAELVEFLPQFFVLGDLWRVFRFVGHFVLEPFERLFNVAKHAHCYRSLVEAPV